MLIGRLNSELILLAGGFYPKTQILGGAYIVSLGALEECKYLILGTVVVAVEASIKLNKAVTP